MANRLADFSFRTSGNRLEGFSADRLKGFDPNRPLGIVEDTIPALDIPGIADPQDVTATPTPVVVPAEQKVEKVVRPRWDAFVDATGRGILRIGSAGAKALCKSMGM